MSDTLIHQVLREARPSSNGYLRACCPFCPDRAGVRDTKFSFAYDTTTGRYRCLRCQVRGKLGAGSAFSDPDLIRACGGIVDDAARAEAAREAAKPPDGFYYLQQEPALSSAACRPAFEFLEGRGVDAAKRARWKIGVSIEGRFRNRVIIPVLDAQGGWVGFVGRSWYKKASLPYLYPRGFSRGEILFNQEAVLKKTDRPLLVVEGCFDAIALGEDAVAVLGSPSWAHQAWLLQADRPVVLVLDCDVWQRAFVMAMNLRMAKAMSGKNSQVGVVRLPSAVDPDECDPQEIWRAAHESLVVRDLF